MSKEKFEVIASRWTDRFMHKDIKFLIEYAKEQAERVQELESIIEQDARQGVLEGLYEENERYRELLTSEVLKGLIRLEYKGNFLPDENWDDFLNFKYSIEALEREKDE